MICPNCSHMLRQNHLKNETRLYLCAQCGARVKTKEIIEAVEDGMSVLEKVTKHLATHKSPITTKQLADRFLVAPSTINGVLRKLEEHGKATRVKVNKIDRWSYKTPPIIVAVPKEPDPPKPPSIHTFNRPIQNSYPAVRGYDD